MGSLSLATAIGGVGKGMQSNVEHSRVMEREDLQRQHDLQLEKQRAASNLSLQEGAQEHQLGMAGTRSEHELGMADKLYGRQTDMAGDLRGHQSDMAGDLREHQTELNAADNETRETIALIGAYQSRTSTTGTRWKGWTVKTENISTFDPETGQIRNEPQFTATRKGSPGAWTQQGDKMILGSDPEVIKAEQDPTKRRAIEDDLLANAGNKQIEQDFIDKYGYLPVRYMDTIAMNGDEGLRQFIETNRSPAYNLAPRRGEGPDQTQGRSLFELGAQPGSTSMRPSIEQVSEGPDRDANIAAKGGTNAELAAAQRQAVGSGDKGGRLTQGGNLEASTAVKTRAPNLPDVNSTLPFSY